jgi:hypothetical protein
MRWGQQRLTCSAVVGRARRNRSCARRDREIGPAGHAAGAAPAVTAKSCCRRARADSESRSRLS